MMDGASSESRKPTLREREVHVWRVALDSVSPSGERLDSCLSPDERIRAAQFIAPLEQRRYVASRIVLRHVLASYHDMDAAAVPLVREVGGRPFVQGADRVFFSLSHTADIGLIAVARAVVGVDVERHRSVARAANIARRILHAETVAMLEALPPPEFDIAFIDAWTQREAHVKAVGGGLFRTPDVLPFDPSQPHDASVRSVTSRADGGRWSVARFLPYEAARAAVAVPGPLDSIRFMDWQDVMHDLRRGRR
ncbi:MAG: 4'-phosphopantetheinyl transferase superfamily protein [Gemmatimonadetes bacterium]|nr:4'-phosphopantetheinyl transferase superfamily protein [Gemmatimonadota bacterium]